MERADGNQPSTAQMRNTASHSLPLALCAVLRISASSSASLPPSARSWLLAGGSSAMVERPRRRKLVPRPAIPTLDPDLRLMLRVQNDGNVVLYDNAGVPPRNAPWATGTFMQRSGECRRFNPNQAIYRWNGADASYLRDFPKKYDATTSIELVRNYRSTPQVVAEANKLLAGTASAGVELRSQQSSGSAVRYAGEPDEVAEARSAADRIARLHRSGIPLVLVSGRTYAQLVEVKDEKTGKKKRTQIFPRYHQLDVVRRLLADAVVRDLLP